MIINPIEFSPSMGTRNPEKAQFEADVRAQIDAFFASGKTVKQCPPCTFSPSKGSFELTIRGY